MASPRTVKQVTFDLMRSFKIDRVFGNPGSTELPFLSNWPEDIEYVLGLQESCVVAMADGYAQATRNAAFVNLHSAAGVGNALGNIYTAYRNQTPMVITAGQQARSILSLQPFLYAERAAEFPRPYVKWSVEPARAQDVPSAIARAYYQAMQPPCGPTFVSIPADDWDRPAPPLRARFITRELGPDPEAVKSLVNASAAAKSPALVVGPAVDRAAGAVELLVELAERMNVPVWTSPFSARCSFPERHPLFAGFLPAAPGQLSELLRPYDLVIVIGAPIFTFHIEGRAEIFENGADIFQITDDAEAAAVSPVGTSIIATMIPTLRALLELMPANDRRPKLPPQRKRLPKPPSTHPIRTDFVLDILSRTMPENAVLVEEVPSARPVMHNYLPVRGQDSFYTMTSGGLGWALPASVGLALGNPSRRTVCLIGDGSMMYSIQALWTAARLKLPITVVVINNSGYGAMRSFSKVLQMANVPGLDLVNLDFVAIAEGFGCAAKRIDKPHELSNALEKSFNYAGCVVVDVAVDGEVPLLYQAARE